MDHLNRHDSEAIVRLVANIIGFDAEFGRKGRYRILNNAASRQAFLCDPNHPVVFLFTPKHASWLNQIEMWFSLLVRKVIRRGNFHSKADRADKILNFITYFNNTMAKTFRWTYQAKASLRLNIVRSVNLRSGVLVLFCSFPRSRDCESIAGFSALMGRDDTISLY